ncbi:MAG: hypothetical protein LBI13_05830 [Streptococcaceae bacterium]|jgi:hypothetical protein|nr:hypothetical protein [Streptococcaceae bacterium]
MLMKNQRVFYQREFKKSDQLYLLDGARVIYDERPGFLYEHLMVRDNMPVLELGRHEFMALPVGESCELSLNSRDNGLFSFIEIQFFTAGEKTASFSELQKKSVSFVVPKYDDYLIRVRMRGSGTSHLLSLSAQIVSLDGLIFHGDIALSENVGMKEIAKASDKASKELLVTFSEDLHYLEAEFFIRGGAQLHFASKNNKFPTELILDYLLKRSEKTFKIYHGKPELLSRLRENGRMVTIE